jgi:hypothetical protein
VLHSYQDHVTRIACRLSGGLVSKKKPIGVTEIAALQCGEAERLLLEYLSALSDSNQTHLAYLNTTKIGRAITSKQALHDHAVRLRAAREALQFHLTSHECLRKVPKVKRTR